MNRPLSFPHLVFIALGSLVVGCSAGGGASGVKGTGSGGQGGESTGTDLSSGGTSTSPNTQDNAGGTIGAGGNSTFGGTSASGTGTAGASPGSRAACSAPATYRNLFVEILGKTSADVDAKLSSIVNQLFHGDSNQTIYYELGSDQAYVLDVANNDIRSEGQSYGMTIAVQMGMKSEFDKLWNYAAKCMRQSNGLFAWQMNPASCTAKSTNAAPDGEEYFAMALMLASRRWGDAGTVNYGSEAKKVMQAMLAARPAGEFNSNPALVAFGPYQNYSDPSYVLPLFYSEWACFDSNNAEFWKKATTDGRTLFQKAAHPTTGLCPGQCNWDGTPYTASGNGNYNYDAQRVPMNIMADFNLNNADAWQTTWAKRMAAFWVKEGLANYGDTYNLDGSGKTGTRGAGPIAMNAMLAFALPTTDGKPFVQAAWDVPVPNGTYRYYSGSLYLLAMLHLSGKFSLFY